jgi:hypothetical protein
MRLNSGSSVVAGGDYGAGTFLAGFVLGTFRVLWVAPHWGALVAVSLELPVILGISWFLCRGCVRRFHVASRVGPRISMGAVAFGVLMSAELGLAIGVFGQSLATWWAGIGTSPGLIGLAGQILFAVFPVIQASRGSGEV